MADVMQQRGHDHLVRQSRLFRKRRALQHMLGHRHWFAQVFFATSAIENIGEKVDDCALG